MTERDMQTLFGKHIKENPPDKAEVYELKICKGTSLPFNSVKEHQIEGLLNAEENGLYHKLTDQPWLPDRKYSYQLKKPFDCFYLTGIKAFVVIWFYKPRQKKVFIKIPIKYFIQTKESVDRKSITEEMALEIGEQINI